jgi:uncharacterized protein
MGQEKSMKHATGVMLACLCVGCSRQQWPEPPAVDQAQYQKQYQTWVDEQQNTARDSSIIVGIWSLPEGETAFGSDRSLPIVLPATAPGRAGVFRRAGETVTVIPATGVTLLGHDDKPVSASEFPWEVKLGTVHLGVIVAGDGRQFVSASDDAHPVLNDFPQVQVFPVEQRWRVAARFDAFDKPNMITIADVRGGTVTTEAVGRLTFRIGDQEYRLTAFGFFKDATNASTTYGYRIVHAPKVAKGEWTVIDFNVASNPPCAYSPYTTCPLPPAENRLAVAIEAGEKRFPTGRGLVQQ